ncbi:hypothetical protein IMCC3317_24660 [Kordia antarctica]|uniref:Uncharacterized protein n=1 Tax=Kordia antarctica TaxID=1218801 RepID=A0A7L4ZK50_9FLAO|nr:hypothetical protein [Kordia antarctica]QHI37088.1 hypothetical protein IMCC3317_24660 [Kordia antarctica]
MKEILFQEAFKKAERQSGSTTKNGLATHLEQVFDESLDFRVNKITFSRYFEQFVENKEGSETNPKTDLLNKISEYIGYDCYEDFVKKNEIHKPSDLSIGISKESSTISILLKFKYYFIVAFILITTYTIFELTEQRWMIWSETEFIEVDFDLEKYDLNQLKIYDEKKIKDFKKIIAVCDSTEFYKPDGSANIWYQKNHNKEHEYFTATGIHPETGKTLRPITKLIVKKYICSKDSLTAQNK